MRGREEICRFTPAINLLLRCGSKDIVKITPGFTGADLANCRSGTLVAAEGWQRNSP